MRSCSPACRACRAAALASSRAWPAWAVIRMVYSPMARPARAAAASICRGRARVQSALPAVGFKRNKVRMNFLLQFCFFQIHPDSMITENQQVARCIFTWQDGGEFPQQMIRGWDPVAVGNRAGAGMACNNSDCGQQDASEREADAGCRNPLFCGESSPMACRGSHYCPIFTWLRFHPPAG